MVDAASADTDDAEQIDRLSEADAAVMLDAVDTAFQATLHGRYGGGVRVILQRAGETIDERPLREVPAGSDDTVILELSLRGPSSGDVAGFASGSAAGLTTLGVVQMLGPPSRGADDVHVLTEVFDDGDPNGAADEGCLTTGVLLSPEPQGVAGQMPGRGVYVLRSGEDLERAGAAGQQSSRGWLPRSPRLGVSRGSGLGSNGHRRAPVTALIAPVSRALLKHIGDHVATAKTVGGAIERIVVGLRMSAANRS